MTYVLAKSGVKKGKELLEMLTPHLSPETEEKVMTFLQYLEAKGETRGIKKGEANGVFKTKKLIVQNLLKQGCSKEFISQVTGLNYSEIEDVLKNK